MNERLPGPNDNVFLRPKGSTWPANANGDSNRELRAVLKRAGISHMDAAERSVDVHALRVTASTRLLRHGVPVHVVARILGHKDVRLTLRHYEDLRVEDTRRAVEGIPDVCVPDREGKGAQAMNGPPGVCRPRALTIQALGDHLV